MTPSDMQGKICLVTGSTRGLGKSTAFALAQQHATVILGCRDLARGEAVLAEIMAASPAATVDLLERLKASPAARILTVTAPSTTKIAFEDVQAERKFSALQAFGASKAANLLFTYDLARRLASVTVNAFYPGLVNTSLMREAPAPLRWLNSVFGQAPERVAQSLVYYASSPEVQAMTGLFFNKGRRAIDSSPYTKDRAVQQQLWEASMALAPLDEVTPSAGIHGEKK